MRVALIIPFLVFSLFACKQEIRQEESEKEDNTELIQLRNKVAQLELENTQKDSTNNEIMFFFNEVQNNLTKISIKEDKIRVKTKSSELSDDDKQWIIEE